jgi:16S rRNA processing protein RimM
MTSPGNRTTPPTKASRRSNRPKAPTTPPRPAPTALDLEAERGGAGPDRPVVLAAIIGAHGIAGEVRLKLFTDDLGRYRSFNGGALTLRSVRDGGNGAIARFAEIPDRTAAERFRGTELTVPRSELPPLEEGEYYHADLLGLSCETEAGEPIGYVVAVENFGAGDILEIEKPDGKRFMVPIAVAAINERVRVPAAFID